MGDSLNNTISIFEKGESVIRLKADGRDKILINEKEVETMDEVLLALNIIIRLLTCH